MKQRYMYRVVIVQPKPDLRVNVSYLTAHHNILTAEREAETVSSRPNLSDARVMVEEFRQQEIEGSAGWLRDPDYLPVRTSQWQLGKSVFAWHSTVVAATA